MDYRDYLAECQEHGQDEPIPESDFWELTEEISMEGMQWIAN